MKKYFLLLVLVMLSVGSAEALILKVNDTVVTVNWENNASVSALEELVKGSPLTINMSPYGGFEQVGSLGTSITRNDVQTTTQAGDIVLYSGNQIVIFYGSNSWAYTRLGKISGMSEQEIKELLQGSNVTITLSAEEKSNPLKSLTVEISSDLTYSFTAGTGGTANLAMTVTGIYSDDTTAMINEYNSEWTLGAISPSTEAITITKSTGVLTVASNISVGDYTVPVTAKATSGEISNDTTKNIAVKITSGSSRQSSSSSGGGCNSGLGILACLVFFANKLC